MSEMRFDLIIIGAGAAGLMAAGEGARLGLKVLVLEGKKEPGLKLLMCGGGRCNVTHAKVTERDYHASCVHTLRHVLKHFSVLDAVNFFETHGAPLQLLEDGCYFSADDQARTVLNALLTYAREAGVAFLYEHRVSSVVWDKALFNVVSNGVVFNAPAVLVATGGFSYPATGADGAGYIFAESFGHSVVATRPALTPWLASSDTFIRIPGIALPVRLSLWVGGKKIKKTEGPLLFTHQGFSGPAVLEMSAAWLDARPLNGEVRVDFFPTLKGEGIDFLFIGGKHQNLKNMLTPVLTERLAWILLDEARVDGAKHSVAGEITNKEKHALTRVLRAYPLPIKDVVGYGKAEITAGGVDLRELKGATLESRLQEGLYFAGEVLDVDGRIGGFNLHWAWASAVAAAHAVAKKIGTH